MVSEPRSSVPGDLEEVLRRTCRGEEEARNQLFAFVCERFRALAVHMFRQAHDPAFSSSDAIQDMCVRLLQLLRKEFVFSSPQHFLGVAGKHLRWSALELLRQSRMGHLQSICPGSDTAEQSAYEPTAQTSIVPGRLEAWQRFHELIDQDGLLEPDERATVTLRWYLGLEQTEIARLLQVS